MPLLTIDGGQVAGETREEVAERRRVGQVTPGKKFT